MTSRFMIIGAGYSGQAFARHMAGKAGWIGGTTRSRGKKDTLRAQGIEPFLFDGTAISKEFAEALESSTHLIVSAAPGEDGDPFLAVLKGSLRGTMPLLEWAGYLSTVGVYGNHDGGWVDEESECKPVSQRSRQRVAAENDWQDAASACDVPLAILRLSGIYGPGRNALVNLAKGTARRLVKPGQVFNRIHVDDIAGALEFLAGGKIGGIYNVTDSEPSPPQDVVAYAAELMGVEPPAEIPFAKAELSPMARSFYRENKRVSNARIRHLGYSFIHPDYREALGAMWNDGSWKGAG